MAHLGYDGMAGTTFEKYGGFGIVSKVVMTFYEMVLDSDIVGHHFDHVDMPRLIDHQTKFISSLMGGPASISDERLRAVHAHFDITDAEFDEIVSLLGMALEEHRMDADDIDALARAIDAKRSLIVKRAVA
ncbi:group 1 truncated hemoglobin [Sedimentitalea sp. JM2-8]|uniref:Group 1 truncated hemoglobin n=1 Tax=Sedimentitalea xiamensis TaxID=3050037 RepID=A0ABT7FBR9_9RHOB|nr:group 1 truncated hemoglobin [Sedimentitalea xiamensis]MDK3072562.1 group 1 truncated hemoglobin [Sedimentitalea xiamensis]